MSDESRGDTLAVNIDTRELVRRVLGGIATRTITLIGSEVELVGLSWLRTVASRNNLHVTSLDGGGVRISTRKEAT